MSWTIIGNTPLRIFCNRLIFLVNQGPSVFQPSLTLFFLSLLQCIYFLCVDKDGWYIVNVIFQIHWLA